MKDKRKLVIQLFNLDCVPFIYWDTHTIISFLQRTVLIHSILYYELNTTVISDSEFDLLSKQLLHLQSKAKEEELEKSQYYYVFYDFDGTTGFDLWHRLKISDKDYLLKISKQVEKVFNNN